MAEITDPENTLVIELKDGGQVVVEMLPDVAPRHVERIKALARAGEYDNVAFHRVIDGFMAQTGDVEHGDMEDGVQPAPGRDGRLEPAGPAGGVLEAPVRPGRARDGAVAEPELGQLAVLHHVRRRAFPERPVHGLGAGDLGMEHVDAIQRGEPPATPDRMVSVRVAGDA